MGDSDQQHILFQEGGVQLAENSAQTLDALARALQERPTLLLNLTGSSGGEDRRQLAERDLLRELEVARDVSREMALQERRVQRAVNRLYENTLSADADTLLDDSIAEREARQLAQSQKAFEALLAHRATELPVSRLQELAGWRANEVKRYLVEQHEVPGDRVFITGGSATTDLPAVELELGAR